MPCYLEKRNQNSELDYKLRPEQIPDLECRENPLQTDTGRSKPASVTGTTQRQTCSYA